MASALARHQAVRSARKFVSTAPGFERQSRSGNLVGCRNNHLVCKAKMGWVGGCLDLFIPDQLYIDFVGMVSK